TAAKTTTAVKTTAAPKATTTAVSATVPAGSPTTTGSTATGTAGMTSTTTAATTTAAAMITTTTTETTTTTTTTTAEPFRYGGYDEWGFLNNDRKLLANKETDPDTRRSYYTYDLQPDDLKTLLSGLRDTEREKISKRLNNPEMPVGGYCYGMSATSILSYYGLFDPSDMLSSAENLADIDKTNITKEVRSAVNYYQLLQYTDAIEQTSRRTIRMTDQQKLQPLVETLDIGAPVLLAYTYADKLGKAYSHAVVAYGIEHKNDSLPIYPNQQFRYDIHVLIYDNNYKNYTADGDHLPEYDLYIDTKGQNDPTSKEWKWCIPRTGASNTIDGIEQVVMNSQDYKNGAISLVLTDPEIMNIHGKFSGSNETQVKYDNAVVSYKPLMLGNSMRGEYGIVKRQPDGSINDAGDEGELYFTADFYENDTTEASTEYKTFFDSVYGFYLSAGAYPQEMAVSMEYEYYLMDAKAAKAKRIQFMPNAEIECQRTEGDYALSMVIDREAREFDWHKLVVSGADGGTVRMKRCEDGSGVILEANSLNDVTIHAMTYEKDAERTFSTEYKSVKIYEICEDRIGIAVDKDGDLVYETELDPSLLVSLGDVDADGEVTNKDAQYVLIKYTEGLATNTVDLSIAETKLADVNGDGKVGVSDAQYILIYYTENTIAGKQTTWEDLIEQ
ncbi:MAG: dockerin type I repeat-containing protein, partial [Oscillospiraceae bacterium]|nr:dockerin type I repeat-containing protein [Oscillospiraceae bacterium]